MWMSIQEKDGAGVIIIRLDVMLAKRKMSVTELSERVGITMANISILKNGKARLQYMYKGDRYSETVDAKNDKEASTQLATFVTAIRNNQVSNSNMTYLVFAQKWLDEYVRPNLSPTVAQNYKMYF